ncbi:MULTISPECIES: hypothetical protein [unclassified Nostoc]|uniref:hypothetical protein n=1 Tax=unclassified Nostoc TaxID=2593658 RepID=UPI0013D3E372|nr:MULTISPECIES: hypothetical protein [unclassified Nostoc]MBE9000767.1 hypothetical protein [Nostoc sp. LEGE 12447]NEU80534.1 hypothetical protein [Nostoc sp. UIC 10630]
MTSEFLLVDSFAIGIRKRDTDQNYTQGFPKNKSYQFGILDEKSLQLLKNLKNNTPVDRRDSE